MRQLLVGLLLAASPLAAQTDWLPIPVEVVLTDRKPTPREWMVGGDIGSANFLTPEFKERGTRATIFVERNLTTWLGAQVDVNCSRGTTRATMSSSESFTTICAANLSGVIPIQFTPRIWPYVRAGAGFATWDEFVSEGVWNVDETSPTFVVAAGTRFLLGEHGLVGLRVDVQRQQTSLHDLSVSSWSFGFGVSIRIPRTE